MNTNLNEAFVVSKRYDGKGNPIAYIDPNKPENKDTFKYKDILKIMVLNGIMIINFGFGT